MIRKWPISIGAAVSMPASTQVIYFAEQNGSLYAWTRDLGVRTTAYEVSIYGTGHTPPVDSVHLGSLQEGPFVWHLFGVAVPDGK